MNLDLTDEQDLLVASLARGLARADAEAVRQVWGSGELETEYALLAEMGLLELVMTAVDPAEPRLAEVALIGEQLGRHAAITPLAAAVALCGTVLHQCGSDPGLAEEVAAGRTWAFASYERGQRDFLAPPSCRVHSSAGSVRVTGEKVNVAHAATAAGFVVHGADADGPVLLAVDADAAGLTVTSDEALGGVPTGRIHLDGVAPRLVLARGDEVDAALRGAWSTTLVLQAAYLAGAGARLLDLTRDHVIEREQFRVPLGSFQAVQHHLADTKMALDSARLMVMNTAWVGPGPDLLGLAAETKAWVAGAAADAARYAHELHGGIGVVDDHEVSLLSRRITAESTLYGSPRQLWALAGASLRGGLAGIPA